METEAGSPGRLARLESGMEDMKALMQRMVDAMTHLAVIDERQQAMLDNNKEVIGRLERIEVRQHQAELNAASNGDVSGRVKTLEEATRDLHIEREKDMARLQTVVWMIRTMWLGVPVVIGAVVWAVKHGMFG
jgi:hypothetical protein